MNSDKPVLHISIYYRGNSNSKTALKRQLSIYTKRLLSNPWEPSVDICLNTFDEQEEKQVLQELTYDTVITYHTKQTLSTIKNYIRLSFCSSVLQCNGYTKIILISKPEDWMLISITLSNADDQPNNDYDIQWSIRQ